MSSKVDESNESKDGIILTELKDILSMVKSELSFAEAKHAAFLAFAVIVLFELVKLYSSDYAIIYKYVYLMFGILWLIPIYKCLSSFNPYTKTNVNANVFKVREYTSSNEDKNVLIFFGNISKYNSPELYLKDLYIKYFDYEVDDMPKLNLDYSKQILINSKITQKKLDLFKSVLIWTKNIFIGFTICMIVVFSANFISNNNDIIKKLYEKNDSISVEINSINSNKK